MTQRYIYGEEPPEEEGSIVGRVLGQLGSAFASIPGVDPALKGLAWTAETGGGVLSATLRGKGLDVLGIGEQRAEDSYLGIDEQDDIWERLQKTRAWQRDRKSAFWGEKFLSEVAGDPLTYLPIGTAIKWSRYGIRSFRGARALRAAVRTGDAYAGQGTVRVSLSPTIDAAEMRYADSLQQGGVTLEGLTPTNSTRFHGQRHADRRMFAENLIEEGTLLNKPELIARGERILDDILEETASYTQDTLERLGFDDVSIITHPAGELSIATREDMLRLIDPEDTVDVMPTISITANVAADKVDDFVRVLGDMADIDFGRTSMVVHQPFRKVKGKGEDALGPAVPDYAVAPMVSMMTKGGKVLTTEQLQAIGEAVKKVSTTPVFDLDTGKSALPSAVGFSVRPDGKGIDFIHLVDLDDKVTKALGPEKAGQKFKDSVKELKEAMDDPEELGGELAGLFDRYEVSVRAVRHYGRRGAGDTTNRFHTSYDDGRRYHDAKRGETAGAKAGLSRKQRRSEGRKNYQQWQQRVGDLLKTNMSQMPGTEHLGFTVPVSITRVAGVELIWPPKGRRRTAPEVHKGEALTPTASERYASTEFKDLPQSELEKIADAEMIRQFKEKPDYIGGTMVMRDPMAGGDVVLFRLGDKYMSVRQHRLSKNILPPDEYDALLNAGARDGQTIFDVTIHENPTYKYTHKVKPGQEGYQFPTYIPRTGDTPARDLKRMIPDLLDDMSLANPDAAFFAHPVPEAKKTLGAVRKRAQAYLGWDSKKIDGDDVSNWVNVYPEGTTAAAGLERFGMTEGEDIAGAFIYRPHARSAEVSAAGDVSRLTEELRKRIALQEGFEADDALRATAVAEDAMPSPTVYGDVPSDEAIRGKSRANNALRRITKFLTRKETGVPMVKTIVHIINPDGVIDAAKGADEGAKALVDFYRTADVMDSVVTADIAALKRMGKPRRFSNTTVRRKTEPRTSLCGHRR